MPSFTFPRWQIVFVILYVLVGSVWLGWRLADGDLDLFRDRWLIGLFVMLALGLIMLASRVFLVVFGLAGIGLLLRGAFGQGLWVEGAFLWLVGGLSAFLLTLSWNARYVAPPMNQEFNNSSYLNFLLLIKHAIRDLTRPKPINNLPAQLSNSFTSIGAGKINSHNAITIHRGNSYVRAAGQGYTQLGAKQFIYDLVDLRPQHCMGKVEATSRDGHLLSTTITVIYRIRQPNRLARNTNRPYMFVPEALRLLEHANRVDTPENPGGVDCFRQVCPDAVSFAVDKIASQRLDDLYQLNEAEAEPLKRLAQDVKYDLSRVFRAKGVQIDNVSFGHIELPPDVYAARVQRWQSHWKAPIKNRGVGQSIRPLSDEQAKIQMEVLQELYGNIDKMTQATNLEGRYDIARRLKKFVGEAATEGMLRSLIPPAKDK